jgi:aspartate racemase
MRTIGLIGGLSWESTVPYYRQINELIRQRLGGLHSARLVLYSVDFHDLERCMHRGDWQAAGELLAQAARALELAGAELIVLCTNTLHKVAGAIQAAVQIPMLHIVDATAADIAKGGFRKLGLLGTRVTMEEPFYRERLGVGHGLEVLVPAQADRELIQAVVFEELCQGQVLSSSRAQLQRIMRALIAQGAQAIILGCTELAMLVGPQDASVPLLDTTSIHARQAAEWALGSDAGTLAIIP